jgi:hypothetical protein
MSHFYTSHSSFLIYNHCPSPTTAYFEGVADIEANTSKELTKLGAVIQVPFKAGNQFLGEGGMQVSPRIVELYQCLDH